jgi:CRISPR-associated protein Cas1
MPEMHLPGVVQKIMIQLPDFREKQILFLEAYEFKENTLKLGNENITIIRDGETAEKVPIHRLIAVFVAGEVTFTSKLIQKLSKSGVSVFLLKKNLETYAEVTSYAEGNYLLRQKQYALGESETLAISKNLVENKLLNQLSLLRSAGIDKISNQKRMDYRKQAREKIKKADNLASLRGIEGIIGKDYFHGYFGNIDWYKRVPRGKVDENNILLDMGYNFLFHFVDSILRLYGFDTYKGIYHQLFFQRKSLSCDMMEPFRCIVDKALYKMHTLEQFDKKDFGFKNGRYYLSYKKSGKYAKIFLQEILRYKEDIYCYIRDHYYLILNEEGEVKKFIIR